MPFVCGLVARTERPTARAPYLERRARLPKSGTGARRDRPATAQVLRPTLRSGSGAAVVRLDALPTLEQAHRRALTARALFEPTAKLCELRRGRVEQANKGVQRAGHPRAAMGPAAAGRGPTPAAGSCSRRACCLYASAGAARRGAHRSGRVLQSSPAVPRLRAASRRSLVSAAGAIWRSLGCGLAVRVVGLSSAAAATEVQQGYSSWASCAVCAAGLPGVEVPGWSCHISDWLHGAVSL